MNTYLPDLTPQDKALQEEYEKLKKEFADLALKFQTMREYESPMLAATYIERIGRLEYELLQMKVELKALNLRRALLQAYINRDEAPNISEVEREIDEKVKQYNKTLHEKAERLKAARAYLESPTMSEEEVLELKVLYRLLVKAFHPDLHPEQKPSEAETFLEVQEAYSIGDLKSLRELALMINDETQTSFAASSSKVMEKYIDELKKKIALLKRKIEGLEELFPFTHRGHLEDKEWIAREQGRLSEEIKLLRKQCKEVADIVEMMEDYKPIKRPLQKE